MTRAIPVADAQLAEGRTPGDADRAAIAWNREVQERDAEEEEDGCDRKR